MALRLYFKINDQIEAVAITNVEAKFEPKNDSTTHFQLFEGHAVKILEEEDGWLKIQRMDQKMGWVPKNVVEKI